jgi:hypothetical protein
MASAESVLGIHGASISLRNLTKLYGEVRALDNPTWR